MRVLYTNFHPGNGGGHTTYLTYLFNGMPSKGIDALIAAPKASKLNRDLRKKYPERVFDVDFPGKPKELFSALANAKKIKKIILDQQIELVHVNGTPDHKVVMLCKWLYRLDFRIIRTKHDSFKIKQDWFANKLYGKYTNRMIVVSDFQYQQVITQTLQNKTTVIHNGVDLECFNPREKSQVLLKKYNIQKDDLVFVSVAGTTLNKGWQYLVQAASQLDENNLKRIKIIIAGNKPHQANIDKYVDSLGMQNNVVFTGFVDDVRELISIADIGFVLSQNEALSIACREMMSMGKPMLISNAQGLPENVNHNDNGWVVQSNSSDKISVFLQNLGQLNLQQFSTLAEKKARQEFGLEPFLNKTMQVYRSVIRCS